MLQQNTWWIITNTLCQRDTGGGKSYNHNICFDNVALGKTLIVIHGGRSEFNYANVHFRKDFLNEVRDNVANVGT